MYYIVHIIFNDIVIIKIRTLIKNELSIKEIMRKANIWGNFQGVDLTFTLDFRMV